MIKWFNRYNFPYSNFHDLNLDWLIKEMKRLIDEWEILKAEWEQMKIEWVEFQAEMQRLWEEYKDLMEAAWEAYKTNLNEEWADYKDEMNAAWLAYQNDLNAQWTAYQNTLNNAWQAYQNAMNEWKNGVDQDIQDKFDEIDAKCAECQAAVEAAIDTLNNLLTTVQQQVEDYLANLPYETIITQAAYDWLNEHGIAVEYLTPEMFGAVGDGITSDQSAMSNLFRTAAETGKPILFRTGANYRMIVGPQLPAHTYIEGNGATISFRDEGDSIHLLGPNIVIKDLTTSKIWNLGNNITNLYLENVIVDELNLAINSPLADNVSLKNIQINGNSFRLGSFVKPADNFFIEDITFFQSTEGQDIGIGGNGFIRGLSTATLVEPITFGLTPLRADIIIESYANVNLHKYAGVEVKEVRVASYSTL